MKKAYETYKDSGIEWIGEIPSHWKTIRFVHTHSGTNVGEAIDKTYWSNNIEDNIFYTAGLEPIRTNYDRFPDWKITRHNDLLMSRNGTPYVYLPYENAYYTDHVIRAQLKNGFDKRYVRFALQRSISQEIVDSVSLATWSAQIWNNQQIPYPPFVEQKAIAEFLDNKCGKIDSLVAELESQVADLEVLKKSEISHVVTKGLDSNIQMKYSDIEWLGEVPENWNVVPLKRALAEKMMYGANESAEYTNRDFPRYIRITDIDENGNLKDDTFKSLPIEKARDYLLQKGDVLFARSGATVGKTFLYNLDEPACFAGYLIKAKCNSNVLSPFYLMQYTKSTQYDTWKNSVFAQATIQNIGADKYSMLPIPIPPLTEQYQIVKYLDSYCQKIDVTIKEIQAQISDLKLYKQSLISEAVTGKIKIID